MIDLVLNTSPVGQSRRDIQTKPERKRPVMNRPIALLVPALAIAIAACSSTASPSAAPTDVSMPSVAPTTTAPSDSAAPYASPAAMGKDIVETATEAKSFSTLLTAATAAGLVETLQGEGPYTVFAPTDKPRGAARPRSRGCSPTRRRSRQSCCTTSSRAP